MKKIWVLFCLASLASVFPCLGLTGEIKKHSRGYYAEQTEAHVFTDESGQSMSYRLFVPCEYDPEKQYPLLLSFHGAGSRGKANLRQLRAWVAGWIDDAVQAEHPCFILMPQCPSRQRWVETDWKKGRYRLSQVPVSPSMTLVKQIFEKILAERSIDRQRIYVMGASMGGFATWDFVTRYPDLVAGAVPICGGGDPSMAKTLKGIPIWAFHGDRDNVIPPSGSQDMIDAIKRAGGTKSRLTLYRGVRHGSYEKAWQEETLVDWLFGQKKPEVP